MAKKKQTERKGDRHVSPRLAFHLSQELLDAFRAFRESKRPKPSESEALRTALEMMLERENFWPPTGTDS